MSIPLDGSTALHQAAFSGSIEIVALLLGLGADGLMRASPPHLTSSNSHSSYIKHFFFAQDFDGRTPLHWCANNNDSQTIDILLDKVVVTVHLLLLVSILWLFQRFLGWMWTLGMERR